MGAGVRAAAQANWGWPVAALLLALALTSVAAEARCSLDAGPARAVTHVIDGETVKLDDGSEVRLLGIVSPRPPDSADDTSIWPPSQEAKTALEALLAGQSVEVTFAGPRADRYGRQLAHLFTVRGGKRVWVQGAMLAAGHARVFAQQSSSDCLDELMSYERLGFEARNGLWSNAAYQVRSAADAAVLMRYRHTLQLVEGTVSEVAEVKGRVFLNFGDDWRTDFTAGIDKGRGSDWPADFKALKGERVRVRGFLERRNGPYIELTHPSQLEILPSQVQAAAMEPERKRRSRRKAGGETAAPAAPAR
jgi:micrococcal nuclease